MKNRLFKILVLPFFAVAIALIGLPILAWLRCFFPGLPGWAFWAALLASVLAIAFSFPLPPCRLRSALHAYGEAVNAPLQTLTIPLGAAWLLWLCWRELPVKAVGWGVLAAYVPLCAYGVWNSRHIRRRDYVLRLDKPCAPRRIVLISDLHLGLFTDRGMTGRIARAVEACRPELVLIAGDIFDNDFAELRRREESAAPLRALAEKCPVYACGGNHDLLSPCPEREEYLRKIGIRVLADECLIWNGLTLLFRRDIRDRASRPAAALLAAADMTRPVLAVDHNPARCRELWAAGADLVLSGHTHGGQTFPGTLLYRLSPVTPYGHREERGRHLIVTSGVGSYGLPLRLGVHSEVVLIELSGTDTK